MYKQTRIINIGIVIISILLFIPFLGKVHLFDWDEINFAESAREMIETGDYLTVRIFYEPFWEKPPLFIWFQVLSMKLFGVNEFAARFPNAICGVITLVILFNLGRKLYENRFGMLWVLAYGGSILPFVYFKSGIIDPWFNLFIFTSITSWVFAIRSDINTKKYLLAILSAALLGLAVLTKGPVSILVFGFVALILFISNHWRFGLNWLQLVSFAVSLSVVGGFWFILEILHGNSQTVIDFIVYQVRLFSTKDAGHGGFPFYHFVILLFGVFPASVFAIQGHKYKGAKDIRQTMHIAMVTLLWVVLLLFSIVKTKIVHYSSLTYFPISYLATYSAYQIINGKNVFRKWQKTLIVFIASVLSLLIIALPIFIAKKEVFIEKGWISHSFTIGNLQADPAWGVGHALIGVLLLAGTLITLFWLFKTKPALRIVTLYYTSIVFIFLSMTFITPGAEKISQHASIEFIKNYADKDVYLHSFFKSYAILFYSKQELPKNKQVFSTRWLTSDKVDKDVYFMMRIDKKEENFKRYPNVEFLYEKNGFVFGVNRKKESKHDDK